MVKIKLRRIGAKGRPFYRVVVAKSTAGRNSSFVETIGTYDPIPQPSVVNINEERALHWLMEGAQPTETSAYVLKTANVLEKFFELRPSAKKSYKFLDKAIAVQTGTPAPAAEPAKAPKAAEKVEAAEPAAAEEAAPTAEAEAPAASTESAE